MRKTSLAVFSVLLFTLLISSCQKERSFEFGKPLVGTLQKDTTGNCLPQTVGGTYAEGSALSSDNFIEVDINVVTPGSYSIETAVVNGYSFKGVGNFSSAGVHKAKLFGSGTPLVQGQDVFTIVLDTTVCSVMVAVVAPGGGGGGGNTSSNDHFILTANSWWSYEDPSSPGDTIKITNVGSKTIGGNSYRKFETTDDFGDVDSTFYRKAGDNYYEYTDVDNYSVFSFDTEIKGDILFLKENLTTGATWNSTEYSGNAGGFPTKLRYVFTCTDANATVTYNGITYTNVYKIRIKPQISIMNSPFTDEGSTMEAFFGKGVGYVYIKGTISGTTLFENQIRHYKVF